MRPTHLERQQRLVDFLAALLPEFRVIASSQSIENSRRGGVVYTPEIRVSLAEQSRTLLMWEIDIAHDESAAADVALASLMGALEQLGGAIDGPSAPGAYIVKSVERGRPWRIRLAEPWTPAHAARPLLAAGVRERLFLLSGTLPAGTREFGTLYQPGPGLAIGDRAMVLSSAGEDYLGEVVAIEPVTTEFGLHADLASPAALYRIEDWIEFDEAGDEAIERDVASGTRSDFTLDGRRHITRVRPETNSLSMTFAAISVGFAEVLRAYIHDHAGHAALILVGGDRAMHAFALERERRNGAALEWEGSVTRVLWDEFTLEGEE